MYLGKVARENFAETHILNDVAGDIVYILGFFVALIMWAFGIVWLVFALATIYKCKPFPFNMGWWGFTFPLGVYAVSTIQFGIEMSSEFFKILGIVSQLMNDMVGKVLTSWRRSSAWPSYCFGLWLLLGRPGAHILEHYSMHLVLRI